MRLILATEDISSVRTSLIYATEQGPQMSRFNIGVDRRDVSNNEQRISIHQQYIVRVLIASLVTFTHPLSLAVVFIVHPFLWGPFDQ